MTPIRAALCAALLLTTGATLASSLPSDQERLRAQAEHDCFDDVQKLCSDVTSDEGKVESCMKAHHAQLGPTCAKDFDAGIGM